MMFFSPAAVPETANTKAGMINDPRSLRKAVKRLRKLAMDIVCNSSDLSKPLYITLSHLEEGTNCEISWDPGTAKIQPQATLWRSVSDEQLISTCPASLLTDL